MKGITEQTNEVLRILMNYEELSSYSLIGGTSLAIHLENRLSEDIDLFAYNAFYPGRIQPINAPYACINTLFLKRKGFWAVERFKPHSLMRPYD